MTEEDIKALENYSYTMSAISSATEQDTGIGNLIYKLVQAFKEQQKEIEKKDKMIYEAKKYCEQIMNYEEYEKKHSKLSRELVKITEGLTTHYKMWRVANNINNILKIK